MNRDSSLIDISGSQSSASTSNGDCVICEGSAHGTHFGVPACRACAAFFRRSFVLGKEYKCRKQEGECNISKDTRYLCRGCRLEKCIRAGMTPDNVQYDREASVSSQSQKSPIKDEERQGKGKRKVEIDREKIIQGFQRLQPKYIHPFFKKEATIEEKMRAAKEIDRITRKIQDIFISSPPSMNSSFHLTALQRMTIGAQLMKNGLNPNPKVLDAINLPEHIENHWEVMLEDIATWMQHCQEFSQLELGQKLLIFKASWCSIMRLDKVANSVAAFGEETIIRRKFYVTKDICVTRDTKFDASKVIPLDPDQVAGMVGPIMDQLFEEVAKPIFYLRLTNYEIVFVMCLAMWNVEGWGVADSTQRAAEAFRERIATELHDYYVHSMGLTNYAYRLIALINIVRANERVQQSRGDLLEMVRLFDMLQIDFPAGDLFDWRRM